MTAQPEFFPPRHPMNRLSDEMKMEFVRAQQSVLSVAFPDSLSFCETVLADLKLSISPQAAMRDKPASAVADLELADLEDLFDEMLRSAGLPESARQMHSENLSRRAQLVRAFDCPDTVLDWVTNKVVQIVDDLPKSATDIEVGRNPGDVLDPYLLAANQALLCEGDFKQAISATVTHKALMILEGLMGHLHEEVIGRMRGNVRNPEPRADNAEILDFAFNPFPGADVVQPPLFEGDFLKLHQIKSKTGTLNSSGGKRLAEQMRQLRMAYPGAELYSHSLVGNTLRGHRSMGGMLRVEPSLIVQVGQASFRILTGSDSGAELLVRVYQAAFELAAEQTGYSVENMTRAIVQTFIERAEAEGEGYLESVVHQSTRGEEANLDSRTYVGGRRRR
ncbi:hypothetical protein R2G56_00950 [Nitratireductor aquimarinus]|uniref:Uncharacterized protein n=1 Tax=Nitratireductor aquimarinus TaxID=889300 RepID=A0ABU4AF25_9HYPH|nr:hypothetical protein [Nitratireductor aquimarinus]MDV6224840.1 hypothetical protein [Nitratireductor aquimarinus]